MLTLFADHAVFIWAAGTFREKAASGFREPRLVRQASRRLRCRSSQ
jgi:hypothetical protein